jgi:hypothetical protein
MQRHRILFTAIICVPSAITCFPLLAANKRLQQSSVDCSVGRITHFERPLVRRLSFAANAQHEDSDIPETSSREEKATITTGTAETQPTLQKISTARAGGRVASSSRRRLANARSPAGDSGSIVLSFGRFAIPLLAAWLFLQMLFGGVSGLISPGSYVFYQSSVYESRVYTSDGKVETKREESIRSNVPSLLERQVKSGRSSSYRPKAYSSPSSQIIHEANDEFDRSLKDVMRF